jgi:biotin synthase-related radical SAM superfamily protein
MDLETKALLLSFGTVQLPVPKVCGRISTAGPGAGGQSVFFQSGERMVRLSVVQHSPLRLEMREGEDACAIMLGDREVARGRQVQPLLHCPEQAYITVSERCIYDCKFCAVPKMRGIVKSRQTIRQMVGAAKDSGRLRAISLTSGVETSPQTEGARVAEIVRDLSGFQVPIGVSISPYPGVNRTLLDAGAVEVKYNIEVVDRDLFSRVCPGIDYEEIMDGLRDAINVFGKNRVFSNVIVGLGESDKTLRQGIDELTEMGVLPVLRAVYLHPLRVGEVEMTRPSAGRLIDLARYLKAALEKNGLDGSLALTGCYRCTGCDLAPGRDF